MASLWLGIETTGATGGAALVKGGEVLREDFFPVMATHSEKLLPGLHRLFIKSGVDPGDVRGVAVSAGPGSYTGLRIGICTAMGLAFGWKTGVVAVDTLRVLAWPIPGEGPVMVAVKARKDEVYAAVYADRNPDSPVLVEPGVYTADALEQYVAGIDGFVAVGNGTRLMMLPGHAVRAGSEFDVPGPSTVALLGAHRAALEGFDDFPAPVYLRRFGQKAFRSVP